MRYSGVAALHGLLLGLRTVGPAEGMGHEDGPREYEENLGTQEKLHAGKTDNYRGSRENTAFPLSANFPSAGCPSRAPAGP